MKRSTFVRVAAASLALLLTTAAAPLRADPIVWSEVSFATPATVYADHTTTSGIKLDGNDLKQTLAGSNPVLLASLSTFSPGAASATFTDRPFSLILRIKDQATGVVGAVTFTGYFEGTVSNGKADLKIKWTSPLSETLHLGHDLYDVTITPKTDVNLPKNGLNGSIDAYVKVSHNPEPSSFLLAALALPVVGWAARRKRRAARAQEAQEAPLAT